MELCKENLVQIQKAYNLKQQLKHNHVSPEPSTHSTQDALTHNSLCNFSNADLQQQQQQNKKILMPVPIYPNNHHQKSNNEYFYNLLVTQTLNHMYQSFLEKGSDCNFMLESLKNFQTQAQNSEYLLWKQKRKEKIARYLEKKKKRKWDVLRYEVRKKIAKTRQRVKGRFVREENSNMKSNNLNINNSTNNKFLNNINNEKMDIQKPIILNTQLELTQLSDL